MRCISILFVSLLGLIGLFQTSLSADEITWIVTDWPPFQYQEEGTYKGYGIELQRLIESEMPEYTHRTITANFARITLEIKSKKNVCAFGMFRTPERESYGYFTIPDLLFFPNVIFMEKEAHEEFGKPNILSLRTLLSDNQKTLAVQAERSFGPVIDRIINESKNKNNIEYVYTGNISKNIFKKLILKRIDFTIEYPIEGSFIAEQIGGQDKVVPVLIEEGHTLLFSHTLCPKTPWGLKVRNAINRALIKIRNTEEYRNVYEQKLEEHLVPIYRKAYSDVFLKVTK